MIVNKSKIKFGVTDCLLFVVSVLFLIGIYFWFPVCDAMGDKIMSCHWAGEVMKGVCILFASLCTLHIFMPDGMVKTGMDTALIGVSVLALFIPGHIISLCGNADMTCRKYTQPWVIVFCLAMILFALADMVFYLSAKAGEKHKRNKAG